jgi:hypothetical protein
MRKGWVLEYFKVETASFKSVSSALKIEIVGVICLPATTA